MTIDVPYSQEAEEAVIGSVLINPNTFILIAGILTHDDFFFLRHSYIWQAVTYLDNRGDPVDTVTLAKELHAMGCLDEIGGPAYLTQIINATPTSVHAEGYARLVQRAAVRRRILTYADAVKASALDESCDTESVLGDAESGLLQVRGHLQDDQEQSIRQISDTVFDHIHTMHEMRRNGQTPVNGIPSGFKDIDELLGGFQDTDLILVGGRPGMGKSSLLHTLAVNIGRAGGRTGIWTGEMGKEQVVGRFASILTGVGSKRMREAKFSQSEYDRFVQAKSIIDDLPVYIDERPAITPAQLRAKAIEWIHRHGLDILLVDYLGLLSGGSAFRGRDKKYAEVSYISATLKELAKELHIPVIAAVQLSRGLESRADKRPLLSDMRDSGTLEQDADIVMFLYRDSVYNEVTDNPNEAEIIISKHRNGPTGTRFLYFEKEATRFSNANIREVYLGD